MYSSTCAELAIYKTESIRDFPVVQAGNNHGDLALTYLRHPFRGNERASFDGPYPSPSQAPYKLDLCAQRYRVLLVL